MNFHKSDTVRKFIFLTIALLYGLILSTIPNELIIDRANYLNYSENSLFIFFARVNPESFISLLNGEFLFLLINILINYFVENPTLTLQIIIFFFSCIFVLSFSFNKNINFYDVIFIALFPIVLLKFTVHLRQAVAISVFYYFYNRNNLKIKLFPLLLSSLIHSSFLYLLFLFFLVFIFKRLHIGFYFRIILYVIVSFIFGLYILKLFGYLGDSQRVDVYINEVTKSGYIVYIWFIFLLLFVFLIINKKNTGFNFNNDIIIAAVIFYIISYFFTSAAPRLFESFLPMILIYCFSKCRQYYIMHFYFHLVYAVYIINISNFIFL